MKTTVLIIFVFILGFTVRDLSTNLVSNADADVAGMRFGDLKGDRDFRKAVKYIVQQDCYVDDNYTYILCD